jgi:CheY-like chemotaxis protein
MRTLLVDTNQKHIQVIHQIAQNAGTCDVTPGIVDAIEKMRIAVESKQPYTKVFFNPFLENNVFDSQFLLETLREFEKDTVEAPAQVYFLCDNLNQYLRISEIAKADITVFSKAPTKKEISSLYDTEKTSNYKPHVLVVDDDVHSRMLMQRFLESSNCVVKCASNVKDALRVWDTGTPPDLVITDWMMPEMNGGDFCEVIRKFNKHTYILVHSILSGPDIAVSAYNAGADDFLPKPTMSEKFVQTVENWIRLVNRRRTMS